MDPDAKEVDRAIVSIRKRLTDKRSYSIGASTVDIDQLRIQSIENLTRSVLPEKKNMFDRHDKIVWFVIDTTSFQHAIDFASLVSLLDMLRCIEVGDIELRAIVFYNRTYIEMEDAWTHSMQQTLSTNSGNIEWRAIPRTTGVSQAATLGFAIGEIVHTTEMSKLASTTIFLAYDAARIDGIPDVCAARETYQTLSTMLSKTWWIREFRDISRVIGKLSEYACLRVQRRSKVKKRRKRARRK